MRDAGTGFGREQAARLAAEAVLEGLRRREDRFRLIVNAAPVLMLYFDREGVCRFANSAANRWFGFAPREARGRPLAEVWGPDIEAVRLHAQRALAGEPASFELWTARSGRKRFLACAFVPHLDPGGRADGFVAVSVDETERKDAEDMLAAREEELERAHAGLERRVRERTEQLSQTIRALQEQIRERQRTEAELVESRGRLRALSMGLESAREEERAHLSRELHDELGQMMTALMVEISTLKKRPRQDAASRVGLSKMTRMVDDTIRVVRRIAKSLRPGMLDDLGLVAALEWQLQEFQENTRIKTVFEVEPENIELDGTRSTCIFRIVQEALTNIARHAKATQVRAALRRDASWIHLEVSDNGRGIRDEEAARASGLGLVGIRERALLCGGEAVIRGVSGKGTVLQVRLPSSYDPDTHLRRPHHRP